jgi:hypothetical protein
MADYNNKHAQELVYQNHFASGYRVEILNKVN